VKWIDNETRKVIEQSMPDLGDKLPERTMETFDQAFGRMRAAAVRRNSKPRKSQTKRPR
jgi:hypothetical protein